VPVVDHLPPLPAAHPTVLLGSLQRVGAGTKERAVVVSFQRSWMSTVLVVEAVLRSMNRRCLAVLQSMSCRCTQVLRSYRHLLAVLRSMNRRCRAVLRSMNRRCVRVLRLCRRLLVRPVCWARSHPVSVRLAGLPLHPPLRRPLVPPQLQLNPPRLLALTVLLLGSW